MTQSLNHLSLITRHCLAAAVLLVAIPAASGILRAEASRSMERVAAAAGIASPKAQRAAHGAGFQSQTSGSQLSANPGSCAENIRDSRKALELTPQDAALELRLARSLTLCGQFAEAIARYRHVLQMQLQTGGALVELGEALLRARRNEEAIPVFRQALELNGNNLGANLGLAQALAASGNYPEALLRYDAVLKTSPENYEALQGKAYVLYWAHEFAQARAIFQRLQDANPNDPQNAAALEGIARAEEEVRWAAARPPPDAPLQDFLRYYEQRLARYPHDRSAMMDFGYTQAQLKNFPAAIQAYRQVAEVYPDDRDAKVQLARVLSWDRQYEASIGLYREVLKSTPDDGDVLEGLARVYVWSGHLGEASQIYQGLLAGNPSNPTYPLELARLEFRLKSYSASREALASLLSADPQNRGARLQLAQLDLRRGDLKNSLKQFDLLLDQNPRDPEALYGRAQISCYQGNLREARSIATTLVKDQPHNFEVLFLLANVERARRRRRAALALLDRADGLSPDNPEVTAMREKVREESVVILHTKVSFARETSELGQAGNQASFSGEDLRTFTYGTTLEMALSARTDSSLSLNYLPSNSPFGGLRGAVGPAEFLYRQTTRLSPRVTLRGGAGLVRFGPGTLQTLPGQSEPVPSATISPIGFARVSFAPRKNTSFDLTWRRSAITYTPLAVRLGVIEDRFEGGVNFFFGSRTELHLHYFKGEYSSRQFKHISVIDSQTLVTNKADHNQAEGASFAFNRNIFRSNHFSFDSGYTGLAFAFASPGVLLGFFNPSFYHRNQLNTRFYGKLLGPFSYDFSGAIGIQQTGYGAVTHALSFSPTLTVKASPRLSLTLGYTHYNFAQTLGTLRGNAVQISTDFRF